MRRPPVTFKAGSKVLSDIASSKIWGEILPPRIVACETRVPGRIDCLYRGERKAVANAITRRVEEFAAGRACARAALLQLGIPPQPLLRGRDGAVLWPDGIVGAITHTRGYCAAAVARRSDYSGLGIDAEEVGRMTSEMWPLICSADEGAWFTGTNAPLETATLLFSAKEAVFKCCPGDFPNFREVTIRLREGTFHVEVPATPQLQPGRYRVADALVFSGIARSA